jgi:hypothetical protein
MKWGPWTVVRLFNDVVYRRLLLKLYILKHERYTYRCTTVDQSEMFEKFRCNLIRLE